MVLDIPKEKQKQTDTITNKFMSFGEKKTKPPMNKVTKNLADIEALLEYEGDDIDQLAMSNSKDALRIIDSLEDMIDARLNMLLEGEQNGHDNYNENIFGLAWF